MPDVVYNPDAHEYLVVWGTASQSAGAGAIEAQRLDAATGLEIGEDDFDVGGGLPARDPAVAYNRATGEYLVAFASDGGEGQADDEYEIFIQRLEGPNAAPQGVLHRISAMGPEGDPEFDAERPQVAADHEFGRYVVTWRGRDTTDSTPRIYFQALSNTGAKILGDRPLSLDGAFASEAKVAYNRLAGSHGEYLAVWQSRVEGEDEVYGRRIDALSTHAMAGDALLISDSSADNGVFSFEPAIAARPDSPGYLVTWRGTDSALAVGEMEVFSSWVSSLGVPGPRVRLSEAGGTGDPSFDVATPAVASSTPGQALVVWRGNDDRPPMAEFENEIFGQPTSSTLFDDDFESGSTAAWSSVVDH